MIKNLELKTKKLKMRLVLILMCGMVGIAEFQAQTSITPERGFNKAFRYSYTGADQTFTVPAGVKYIKVKAWGAAGGGSAATLVDSGGAGGFIEGKLTVTSGQTLTIKVGQGGNKGGTALRNAYNGGGAGGFSSRLSPAYHGAGGGGMSSVQLGTSYLIIAGGGGGSSSHIATGGAGGGFTGSDGIGINLTTLSAYPNAAGKGGTSTAGGAGGTNPYPYPGNSGTQYNGGNGGGNYEYGGGGGGGGYYGGGGAAGNPFIPTIYAGSGGGGSSYAIASASDVTSIAGSLAIPPRTSDPHYVPNVALGRNNLDGGNGMVIIQYFLPETCGNGIDDDGDGLTDCEDPECATSGLCAICPIVGDSSASWKYVTPDAGFDRALQLKYTGAEQLFTVPAGVTSLRVKAWGAGGGGNGDALIPTFEKGGAGAYISGTIPVTPGDQFLVIVGQGGMRGSSLAPATVSPIGFGGGGPGGSALTTRFGNGASGGGLSGLFLSDLSVANARLIAAGGGGVSASPGPCSMGGNGGAMNGDDGCSLSSGSEGKGATVSTFGQGSTNSAVGGHGSYALASSYPIEGWGRFQGGGGNGGQDLAQPFNFNAGASGGGGGGGGYYGGGGGTGQQSSNGVLLSGSGQDGGGGGGSSYLHPTITGTSAIKGKNDTAANISDVHYIGGLSRGGRGVQDGGHGLIVIQWGNDPCCPTITNNTASPTSQAICAGATPATIVGSTPTLSSGSPLYRWFSSSSASGPWAAIAGATSKDYTPPSPAASASNSTTYYRRQVYTSLAGCDVGDTSMVRDTFIVKALPNPTNPPAGVAPLTCTASDGQMIISGLISGQSYTVSWTGSGGASMPTATNYTASSAGQITITGLSKGTYSTIVVTSNGCASSAIGPVTLVGPVPVGTPNVLCK